MKIPVDYCGQGMGLSTLDLCKFKKSIPKDICGFTCDTKAKKTKISKPMKISQLFCAGKNVRTIYPYSGKSKNKVTANGNQIFSPCEAFKPKAKPKPYPCISCTKPIIDDFCNADLNVPRKCNQRQSKIVMSKELGCYITDLSGSILSSVKGKLSKPKRPKNNLVFSIMCAAKSKKHQLNRCKMIENNAAGFCILMEPGMEKTFYKA